MSFKSYTMKASRKDECNSSLMDNQKAASSCKDRDISIRQNFNACSKAISSQTKVNNMKQCKIECKRNKDENNLSLTFVSELDTIYEEQSICEMSSICTEDSFFLISSEDSNSSKRLGDTNICDDFTCYNQISELNSSMNQTRRFEDRFECSQKMESLWKRCIKSKTDKAYK